MTPPDSRLPARLRVVGATDLERRVLEAASRELPSVELTQKMQQALGLSIAAGAITAAAAKSSSTAAATAAGSAPAFAWPAISVGVLALAMTGAVVGLRSTASRQATGKPTVTVAAATPAAVPAPAPIATTPLAAASAGAVARGVERPASFPARPRRHAFAAPTPSDLRAEIALVDAARGAVATGANDRALTLLNRYDTSYHRGTFRPEVTALRIEALDHLGRTAQAQTLAQRFIAAHPDSPLADRVARVAGTTTR